MPLSLIFIDPDNYTIDDNGVPGDNISVIRDGNGTVIFNFGHPADELNFTVSIPGVNLNIDFTDSLGTANLTLGSLTNASTGWRPHAPSIRRSSAAHSKRACRNSAWRSCAQVNP